MSKNSGVPGSYRNWRKLNLFGENSKPFSRLLGTGTPRNLLKWTGSCVGCGEKRRRGVGLFCCNFLTGQEALPSYGGVWFGECYQESQYNPYPRLQGTELELEDIASNLLQEEKDQQRYQSTRNRDHLMKVPFEYDLCHSRIMNKRNPVSGGKRDDYMCVTVRRAL